MRCRCGAVRVHAFFVAGAAFCGACGRCRGFWAPFRVFSGVFRPGGRAKGRVKRAWGRKGKEKEAHWHKKACATPLLCFYSRSYHYHSFNEPLANGPGPGPLCRTPPA